MRSLTKFKWFILKILPIQDQDKSAWDVEYTDCISAGGLGPHEYLRYDPKQSDHEAPVMLELWGMHSTPSLPSLRGPLWPGVVAPDRILSMGQIELLDI